MVTLKIPYICIDEGFVDTLLELRTLQSSYVRSAYQLFKAGQNQYEVQKNESLQTRFGLGSWLRQSGLIEAKSIHKRNGDSKVIFGGKRLFYERLKGKITAEVWKEKRLSPLYVIGERMQSGNRLFKLNISNSSIIFKPSSRNHFNLQLPILRNNWKRKLETLQAKAELKELPYTVRLDDKFIYLTFEEERKSKATVVEGRFLGIDLNPEHIGVSIIQNSNNRIKVLYTREYTVKKIVNEMKQLKVPSADPQLKHLHNKLNFETIEISKDIQSLAIQWNCKGIFVEDLSFKGNANIGRKFNRLTKNFWKIQSLVLNLERRCKLSGLTFYKVSPQYSSVIGNLMYSYTDPINASIEIARRGAQVIFEKDKKNRKFYPDYSVNQLKDQWKEHFSDCIGWKQVFDKLKNLGMKYRVSAADIDVGRVFQLNSIKSKVFLTNLC